MLQFYRGNLCFCDLWFILMHQNSQDDMSSFSRLMYSWSNHKDFWVGEAKGLCLDISLTYLQKYSNQRWDLLLYDSFIYNWIWSELYVFLLSHYNRPFILTSLSFAPTHNQPKNSSKCVNSLFKDHLLKSWITGGLKTHHDITSVLSGCTCTMHTHSGPTCLCSHKVLNNVTLETILRLIGDVTGSHLDYFMPSLYI